MGYKQLSNRLSGYDQEIPEWLQGFFDDYSSSPYNDAVLGEMERRGQDSFGQNLGQMANFFGGAGRTGSGGMGRAMGQATAENANMQRGQTAGLLNQDYQGWLQRALQASGILGNIQQTGMAGTAQGYGADQSRIASKYSADQSLLGTKYASDNSLQAALAAAAAARYGTDAYRDIGMGNLGMNQTFGMMDRDYRGTMMPYEQINMLGQGMGNLLGMFGSNNQYGTQQQWGPQLDRFNSIIQGALGGGTGAAGMGGGKGGGGNSANVWGQNSGMVLPGGTWGASDERLKSDIVRYPVDYLPGVPLATWIWRETGKVGIGVIAQDMIQHYPERVAEANGFLCVRY